MYKALRLPAFSTMLAALLVGIFYCDCINQPLVKDPDIGWHLRNAQIILQQHFIIRQDFYTFSLHRHAWMDPEWLSEVLFYASWKWFGIRGIEFLSILLLESLLVGVVVLAWQRARSIRPALFAAVFFILFVGVSMGPRTQLFGWCCFVLELAILNNFRSGTRYRTSLLWTLPPLFALWINLHGSWPIGLIMFSAFIACGLKSFRIGTFEASAWTAPQRNRLLLVAGLCLPALLLNPYGWHLVVYPFVIAGQHKLTLATVQEWQSLDFHSFLGRYVFCLVAAVFLVKALRTRTWALYDAITLFIALLAGFSYVRFLLLTGVILCPLLADEAGFLGKDKPEIDKRWLNAAIVTLILFLAATHLPTTQALTKISDETYPAKAVAYLRQHPPTGPVLNDFNWGGYLIWNLPNQPIFIDTRTDVFEQTGLYQDYFDLISLKTPIETYHQGELRYALFPKNTTIANALARSPNWTVEYSDDTSVLLHRIH